MPTPLVEYLEGSNVDGLSLLSEEALVANEENKETTKQLKEPEKKLTPIPTILGRKTLYEPEGSIPQQIANQVSGSFVSMLVDTYYGAQNIYSMATDTGAERDANFEQILKNSAETQAWVNEVAAPTYDRYEDNWLLTTLPSAMGSMLGFWVGAELGGGVASLFGSSARMAISGGIGASITGALPEGVAFAREAYAGSGGNLEKAKEANWKGMLIGMTEGLPIGAGLYKAEKALLKGGVKKDLAQGILGMFDVINKKTIKTMGIEGMEELIQETGQTLLENWQASEIFDASRALWDGAAGAGSAGFVTGALMTFLMSGLGVKARFNSLTPEEQEAYISLNNAFKLEKKNIKNPADLQHATEKKAVAASLSKVLDNLVESTESFDNFINKLTDDPEVKAEVESLMKKRAPEIAAQTLDGIQPDSSLLNIIVQHGKNKALAAANAVNETREKDDQIDLDALKQDKVYGLNPNQVKSFTDDIQLEVAAIMTDKRMDKALGEEMASKVPEEMMSDVKLALALGLKAESLALLNANHPNIDSSIKDPLIEKIEKYNDEKVQKLGKVTFDAKVLNADDSITEAVLEQRTKTLTKDDIGIDEATKPTENKKTSVAVSKEATVKIDSSNEVIPGTETELTPSQKLTAFLNKNKEVEVTDDQTGRTHKAAVLTEVEKKVITPGPEDLAFDDSGKQSTQKEVEIEKTELAAKKEELGKTENEKVAAQLAGLKKATGLEFEHLPPVDLPNNADLKDPDDPDILNASKPKTKFQTSTVIDDLIFTNKLEKPIFGTEISVGELLKDFKGRTVKDLSEFIIEQRFSTGGVGELLKDLVTLFPGMLISIESIPRSPDKKLYAAAYQNQTIYINKDRILNDAHVQGIKIKASGYISQTLTHELLHALLGDFMNSNTIHAKRFISDMKTLLNSVKKHITQADAMYPLLKVTGETISQETSEMIKNLLITTPTPIPIQEEEDNTYMIEDGEWMLKDGTRIIVKGHEIVRYFTALPKEYLEDVEEFIAYAFTEQGNLRKILQNMEVGVTPPSQTKKSKTGWRKYVDLLIYAFKNSQLSLFIKKKDPVGNLNKSGYAQLEFLMQTYTPDIIIHHMQGLSPESKYVERQAGIDFVRRTDPDAYRDIETLEDLLDRQQITEIDDETADELTTLDSIRGVLAEAMSLSKDEIYKEFGKLDYIAFLNRIETINGQTQGAVENFLKNLYKYKYKEYTNKTYESFRKQILVRTLRDFKNRKPQNFISLVIDKITQKDVTGKNKISITTQIQDFGSQKTFKDDKGRTKDIYQEDTILTDMVKNMNIMLGFPEGALSLAYVESVSINGASKKLRNLSAEQLGFPAGSSTSEALSKIFAQTGTAKGDQFLYLGNFGGKSTFAVIKISQEHMQQLTLKLAPIFNGYMAALKRETLYEDKYLPALLRSYIWDMWFNNVDGKGAVNYENSIVHKDYNTLMKRGGALTQRLVRPLIDKDLIADLKNDQGISILTPSSDYNNKELKGVRYDSATGKVLVNTYAWKTGTSFMTDLIIKDLTEMGFEVDEDTIIDINKLGVAIADGASFYVFNHFDKAYRHLHGKLKVGAIKNVYVSDTVLTGEGYQQSLSLFIKHAIHGVSSKSPLGAWMIKNQIGIVTSDESAKEGISQTKDLTEEQQKTAYQYGKPFDTDMSNYFYIKDENDKGTNRGTLKQPLGTSGLVHTNVALSQIDPNNKAVKAALKLVEDAALSLNTKLGRMTDDQFFNKFMKITMNPTSYQGRILSRIFGNLLTIPLDEAKAKFSALIDDPIVAEQLNLAVSAQVSATIEHRFTGARAALNPDIGTVTGDQVANPIGLAFTLYLTNKSINDPIFVAAVPSREDRIAIVNIAALQQQKTMALTKRGKLKYDEKIKKIREELKVRHPGFKSRSQLVDRSHPDVKAEYKKYLNERIEFETGRIKDGFIILSEDIAEKFGIRPGDKVITFITPTDSMLGVTVVEVAGIAKSRGDSQVINENSIIMNSEYIQSMVGKDFDIDTIGIIPYSLDWKGNTWKNFTSVLGDLKESYLQELEKTYTEVLKDTQWTTDGKITREQLFGEERNNIMIAYGQAMLGERTDIKKNEKGKIVYDPFEDFHTLNDDYLIDVAPIISERRKHTLLSAIGFSLIADKGNKIGLDNNMWFKLHVLHLIMTNHTVDAPSNTHIFEYNGNFQDEATQARMYNYMWGNETGEGMDIPTIKALNQIYTGLFDTSIKFMKNLSIDTKEKMNLFEQMKAIKYQKEIFALIDQLDTPHSEKTIAGQQAFSKLVEIITTDMERVATNNGQWELNPEKLDMLNKQKNLVTYYLSIIKIDNLYNYPLFNTIKNLDITKFPLRGLTYNQHVRVQNTVITRIMEGFPALAEALQKSKEFVQGYLFDNQTAGTLKGELYVPKHITSDSFMTSPTNPHFAEIMANLPFRFKKIYHADGNLWEISEIVEVIYGAIGMTTCFDEPMQLKNNKAMTLRHRDGRATAFGPLFRKILTSPRVETNPDLPAVTWNQAGYGWALLKEDHGGIAFVKVQLKSNGKYAVDGVGNILNEKISSDEILENKSPLAKEWNTMLFDPFWENKSRITHESDNATEANRQKYANIRKLVNNFIPLQKNISVDDRILILKDFLTENIYLSENLTLEERALFWLSIFPQENLGEPNAYNLIINKMNHAKIEAKPTKFQTNTVAKELLKTLDPELFQTFIEYQGIYQKRMFSEGARAEITPKALNIDTLFKAQVVVDETNPDFPKWKTFEKYMERTKPKEWVIKRYTKFKKAVREGGYSAGYKELQDLGRDIAVRMAMAELGIDMQDLKKDLDIMTPQQFEAHYNKFDSKVIDDAYKRYRQKQTNVMEVYDISEDLETDQRLNNLEAYYWMVAMIGQSYAKSGQEPTNFQAFNKMIRNIRSISHVGPDKEVKNLSFEDTDTVLARRFLSTFSGALGDSQITVEDVMMRNKDFSNRKRENIGEVSLALTKIDLLNEEMKYITNEMRDIITSKNTGIETVIDLSGVKGEDNRKKFLKENQSKTKTDVTIDENDRPIVWTIDWMVEQIKDYGADKTGTSSSEMEQVYLLAQNMSRDLHVAMYDVNGEEIYILNNVIQRGMSFMQFVEVASNDMFNTLKSQGKVAGEINGKFKLRAFAALKLRYMLDVQAKTLVQQTIDHLDGLIGQLQADTTHKDPDTMKLIENIRDKFILEATSMGIDPNEDLGVAAESKLGNYVSRKYDPRTQEILERELLATAIYEDLQLVRTREKRKVSMKDPSADAMEANKSNEELMEDSLAAADEMIKNARITDEKGDIVGMMIRRKQKASKVEDTYIKNDPQVFQDYINDLVKHVQTDIIIAEAYITKIALIKAGNPQWLIEDMGLWFSDQVSNKYLSSKAVDLDDLQKGQEINFVVDLQTTDIATGALINVPVLASGILAEKPGGATIKLKVNVNAERRRATFRAERYADQVAVAKQEGFFDDEIGLNKETGKYTKHISDAVGEVNTLMSYGYVSAAERAAIKTYGELYSVLYVAYERVLKDTSKFGVFKQDSIRITDEQGVVHKGTKVRRYRKRGITGMVEAFGREHANAAIIDGTGENIMTIKAFKLIQSIPHSIDYVKHVVNWFVMGGPNGIPAFLVNYLGAQKENLIDSPWDHFHLMKEWKAVVNRIKFTDKMDLNRADRAIYSRLNALGFLNKDDILDMAMAGHNVSSEELLLQKPFWTILTELGKATKQSVTYKKYRADMARLQDKILRLKLHNNLSPEYRKLLDEKELVHLKWVAHVNGLLSYSEQLSEERQIEIYNDMLKKAKAGELNAEDFAEKYDLTPAQALWMLTSKSIAKLYTSKTIGVGLQATAEKLRLSAYGIGYLKALRQGHDEVRAHTFGQKMVERAHVIYDNAHKQKGSNTKGGKLMMMYSTYKYGMFKKFAKQIKDSIPNYIKHKKRLTSWSDWPAALANIKGIFNHNINLTEEAMEDMVNVYAKNPDGSFKLKNGKKIPMTNLADSNISGFLAARLGLTLVSVQIGSTLLYGLANSDDPVGQAFYSVVQQTMELFGEDDKGIDEEVIWAMNETIFWSGIIQSIGINTTLTAMAVDWETAKDRLWSGRFANQTRFLEKILPNTTKSVLHHNNMFGNVRYDDQYTLWDPKVLDRMLGMKLIGYTKTDNEWMDFRNRFPMALNPLNWLPWFPVEFTKMKKGVIK